MTSLPFADAADVILLARQLENENPMVSDRKSSRRGRPADAVSDDAKDVQKTPKAFPSPRRRRRKLAPKKRDNVQITSESSRFSKHQSSKEVFAARAFCETRGPARAHRPAGGGQVQGGGRGDEPGEDEVKGDEREGRPPAVPYTFVLSTIERL